MPDDDPLSIKEQGNTAFKAGKLPDALRLYQRALTLTPGDQAKERATLLKNLAAVHLKQESYAECVEAASQAVELVGNDPKALFRRCQALEHLNRIDEAYKDATVCAHMEPKDQAVQQALQRLHQKLIDLRKKLSSTEEKVNEMLAYFGGNTEGKTDMEKRRQAANNLVVLARESSGSQLLMDKKAPELMARMLKNTQLDGQLRLAAIRILGQLFKGSVPRCRELLRNRIGLPPLLNLYMMNDEETILSVSVAVENILHTLSGWIDKEKPDWKVIAENQDDIDHTMKSLLELSDRAVLSAAGRESVIDVILKNVQENLSPGLAWTRQFMENDGIGKFLRVAIVQPAGKLRDESSLPVTNETRIHVALALQKIYDDLDSDKKRNVFREKCEAFVQELLVDPNPTSKIKAVLAVDALLQGPIDVGNFLLGSKGILEMLMWMADSEDSEQQMVAVEAMVHAATKKDKNAAILSDGLSLLEKLCKSADEKVQVRALVGLCKLGASGGTDASRRPLPAPMMHKLAENCRRFLLNPSKDFDLRKWAAEGLAYLTLEADVKEALVEDRSALRSLVDLGRTGNENVVYGVVSVLANLVNAYDYEKEEVTPEMKDLAKFAKQHVPQEHAKDSLEFVQKRVDVLVEEGVAGALVALSKSESKKLCELMANILNVLVEKKEHRGMLVQHGAAKALLRLSQENTEKGKAQAAQALARIGITINPEMAFPGQRAAEVVRPLLNLLDIEKSALHNFEALLALTNLAQMSESVRQRIARDGGLAKVEHYLYEDHDMLKRAATECICNLMLSPEVQEMFIKSESDRIKLLTLFAADEDRQVGLAAAGALAMLTQDPRACERFIQPPVWLEVMKEISVADVPELRVRALYILGNLMEHSEAAAEAIAECELLEILMATSQLSGRENKKVKDLAFNALKFAHKKKLIAPNPDFDEELEDEAVVQER